MASRLIFLISLWAAKFTSFLIAMFHFGQASNLPGKIALIIQKDVLRNFKLQANCKVIFITGTNGKSTTSGLIAEFLKTSSAKVVHNKSGANLLSGIASTFCNSSDLLGNLNCNYIVLEVDEETLPLLTNQLVPDIITITNFFSD